METPVIVDFPLRGEWIAPNTPGKRVPSHGIDILGERYAYDFVRPSPGNRSLRYYRTNPLRYILFGAPLQDFYGWGQPVYSATRGVVVQVADGWPERNPAHPIRDIFTAMQNRKYLDVNRLEDVRELAGNYVIVESADGFVVFAHAQTGSIRVTLGEQVIPGQILANVGHSGNSTAPHLHFHLMDRLDFRTARGLPCCFREYEVFRQGSWHRVENGIPLNTDRIRKL